MDPDYRLWSATDWVSHYAGLSFADAAMGGSFQVWNERGEQGPAYDMPPGGSFQVWDEHGAQRPAYDTYAGQAGPLSTAERIAHHGAQTSQAIVHSAADVAKKGIDSATSGKVLLAALAAFGIFGWVMVKQGQSVARAAPSVVKALPLFGA